MDGNRFHPDELLAFYEGHLKDDLLRFWLTHGIDGEYGGYYTCFDNSGRKRVSTDKYTWSQGRFVWLFSKLAELDGGLFSDEERGRFLQLAADGAGFLMRHVLLDNGNCAFVLTRTGEPKPVAGGIYDSSIFADCFVVLGLSRFAKTAGNREALEFAASLHRSIENRLESGRYRMEPYPTPPGWKAHSIPMTMLHVTHQLAEAMNRFGDGREQALLSRMKEYIREIFTFVGDDGVLREMIGADGTQRGGLLGRYANPGHAIEDMWFVAHAALRLGDDETIAAAARVVKKMLDIGWDEPYGGLLLYADPQGGPPQGDADGYEQVSMVRQIRQNWDNKLWWPHSETLYATLLFHSLTGDETFRKWYRKTHDYTFATFPNPDREIGEWIQIRERDGKPVDKVVALPVKDPFHIMRNVILIIELLRHWGKPVPAA